MSTPTITRSAAGSQGASGEPVWSWTFPGAPICINLTRSLVARLQSDVDGRTRSLGDTARELGGILFGRQRAQESMVDIDDYAWLPSEASQDGKYSLNIAELERLRAERAGASSVVIGYFRTDFGANLELRDAEIDLVGKQFSDPTNVVLLICSSRPHTGGFFFWMGEGVISPFSLMDFPLDVARLPFHNDADVADSFAASVSGFPAEPDAPPVAAAEPEPVKWPVLDPAPKKFNPPATVVQMPLKVAPAPPPPVISVAQPPEKATAIAAAAAAARAHENALREVPRKSAEPSQQSAPGERRPSRAKGVWLSIAWTLALLIGLCLATGVIVIAFRGGPLPLTMPTTVSAPKPAAPPAPPLQLNVEAQGTGLNIRWDARSAAVSDAREGQLTLSEANKTPVVIPLTAQQLTIGHIYFQSSAERLEVQLETTGNSGEVSRESVLAVSSLQHPPVMASATPAPSSVQSKATAPAPIAPSVPVRRVETIPIPNKVVNDSGESSAQNKVAARAFTTPTPNQTAVRMPVIDQPSAVAPQASAAIPVAINNALLSMRIAPPPAPVAVPAAVPQASAPQQVRVTSSLQAAKLRRKVSPTYPPVAIAGRIQGLVKFTATIAKDGTIGDLQVKSGPSVFVKPATDAVKQWTYQPTLLNGQPVEVVTEIDVNFTLSQ